MHGERKREEPKSVLTAMDANSTMGGTCTPPGPTMASWCTPLYWSHTRCLVQNLIIEKCELKAQDNKFSVSSKISFQSFANKEVKIPEAMFV